MRVRVATLGVALLMSGCVAVQARASVGPRFDAAGEVDFTFDAGVALGLAVAEGWGGLYGAGLRAGTDVPLTLLHRLDVVYGDDVNVAQVGVVAGQALVGDDRGSVGLHGGVATAVVEPSSSLTVAPLTFGGDLELGLAVRDGEDALAYLRPVFVLNWTLIETLTPAPRR